MEKELAVTILKSVILALNLKVYELGDQLEINRQQMYDYSHGKKTPGWVFWMKLKANYPQLSGDYLLTGKGAILLDQ